jgi:hypothetical protein
MRIWRSKGIFSASVWKDAAVCSLLRLGIVQEHGGTASTHVEVVDVLVQGPGRAAVRCLAVVVMRAAPLVGRHLVGMDC